MIPAETISGTMAVSKDGDAKARGRRNRRARLERQLVQLWRRLGYLDDRALRPSEKAPAVLLAGAGPSHWQV